MRDWKVYGTDALAVISVIRRYFLSLVLNLNVSIGFLLFGPLVLGSTMNPSVLPIYSSILSSAIFSELARQTKRVSRP